MSFDRSLARCSFCGRHSSEVRRMIAGPGAAYICDDCLDLCNEILHDATPFSAQALELASRPPVVVAAPQPQAQERPSSPTRNAPQRIVTLELEQKQQGMTLILHQLHYYQSHFELHYLWIRPPFSAGFAFVPRIIFSLQDDTRTQWTGERGGILLARPEDKITKEAILPHLEFWHYRSDLYTDFFCAGYIPTQFVSDAKPVGVQIAGLDWGFLPAGVRRIGREYREANGVALQRRPLPLASQRLLRRNQSESGLRTIDQNQLP